MLAVMALLAVSCIKDEPVCSTCEDNPDGKGILLSFSAGTDTRSNLYSSEVDYRDVKAVCLYVFQGTDANAECILSEDVDWQGDISQTYWISTDLSAGSYTFLAIGTDDNAGSVYGLTADYRGTLGECMARLAAGKGKADMATAQFFAGYVTRTVAEEEDVVDVEVTLTRKVAGVLAYLKNIPCWVDFGSAYDGKATVTDLRISLGSSQNTQMALWNVSAGNAVYGSEPLASDDKVLFEVNLRTDGYTPDAEGRYYTKAGIKTDELQTVDNSLLRGAFLLPLAESEESTLKLELLGFYTTGDGTKYQDVVVKTYTIQNSEGKQIFSIDENKLYCIGKKLSDASTDGDKPADLSGNILQVNVIKWNDIEVDNSFPTVIGPARIESDYNQNVYIFDAPETEFPVYLQASSPVEEWRLKVCYYNETNKASFSGVEVGAYEAETPQENWIHFAVTDAEGKPTGGYVSEITDPNGDDRILTVVLNDFAVQRTLEGSGKYYIETADMVEKLKKDYRTAYIEIYTSGTVEPYRLLVRQYNALTIYAGATKDVPNGFRAAARLDYGCHFDKETGAMVRTDTAAVGWGYWSSIPLNITGDLTETDYWVGAVNTINAYNRYKKGSLGGENYVESILQKLRKEVIEIAADGTYTSDENKIWCLPAYHEMWGVADYINPYRATGEACQDLFNMKVGDKYWCSTIKDNDINESLYIPAGTTNYLQEADRDDKLYARPIRQFYTN